MGCPARDHWWEENNILYYYSTGIAIVEEVRWVMGYTQSRGSHSTSQPGTSGLNFDPHYIVSRRNFRSSSSSRRKAGSTPGPAKKSPVPRNLTIITSPMIKIVPDSSVRERPLSSSVGSNRTHQKRIYRLLFLPQSPIRRQTVSTQHAVSSQMAVIPSYSINTPCVVV